MVSSLAQLKRVQEDGDLLLYRGRKKGEGRESVLAVAPALDPPAPATIERLQHEFALKQDLDAAWAARPLELVHERGRTLLVLEDPGGVPLTQLLGRPLETVRALRLAIKLVQAVGQVHQRGLIHKDLRPAHILVAEASGEVHLTGFGLASPSPREHPASDHLEFAAGALPYMAPEQTGRMNRSVDARSDLYAVGVVLYEMLTGVLPFRASDPMEWVHSHIARAPPPPDERVPDLPRAISAVVMKCLAKTAEDRYQTAAGLAADLKRCLAQWVAARTIEPFTPGAHDIPDVLRIPEKLYGREAEVERLLEAFERVVAQGPPELVLVSGYSGVGKSSVVNELHKALVPPRGLFAGGKFDQYKRGVPYSTLAQAFQSLIQRLLGQSEVELDRWREDLRSALEPNAALITNLVPDLKLILGEPPPVPDLPPQEAEYRFRRTLRRFIGVFARPEHPLALFLDDLQWLDAATLSLLDDLTTQPDVGSLLLVGAYRDNEVGPDHPLMRSLAAVRQAGGRVTEIALSPLGRGDVERLVADSLHCPPQTAAPLADLVYGKSGGNPFFIIQFLTALAEEKLLAFRPGAGWIWDLKRIRAKDYTDNVADLMVAKLARLPPQTREILRWLAALGDRAETAVLALVRERPAEAIHAALREAVQAGVVLRQDEVYAFLHDRVHEAAYSLIPQASRPERHLRIGQILSSSLPPDEIAERIFEVVTQLNRGAALVEELEERERIAELDLHAGERAKASTAYAAALTYFATGAQLLGADCWARRYDLAFALELNRAECEFLTGDTAAADRRLAELRDLASNVVDRAAVTCRRLALYTAMGRVDLGVEAGLDYLRQVGIDWPAHPTDHVLDAEYDALWTRLGERPIEALIDLPRMRDPERRATFDVLQCAQGPAYFSDRRLFELIVGRKVNISLEYGAAASAPAFAAVAIVLWTRGDYQSASRFGKLSLDLVEKNGQSEFTAEVYHIVGMLLYWSHPIREVMELVQRAYLAAQKAGNLSYMVFSASRLIGYQMAVGAPLAQVQVDVERTLELVRKAKFEFIADCVVPQLRLVRVLRGLTPAFGAFDDADFDEGRFETHLRNGPPVALFMYAVHKLQACVFALDFIGASAAVAKAEPLLWTKPGTFEIAEYHFYGALARAASYAAVSAEERREGLAALHAHHELLKTWAARCPENFADRAALVGAEIARIEGRDLEAMRLYEAAIRAARDNGFAYNEALANEWASRFYFDRGVEKSGLAYLRDARAGYALWGAEGKVRQLDAHYPQLAAHAAATGSALGQLDVSTLIKASQAVSGDIDLSRLIETLMTITLQNAGADRGLLLLPREGAFLIEAEARAGGAGVEVRLRQAALSVEDGPESVINLVIRTRESALLEDGSRPGPVWESAFGARAPPRSAFCLPLLRQGRLAGVLYLENSQAAYAFTPKRLAVLEVLVAQAAIALENARLYGDLQKLYGDLQEREAKIRRLIDSNIIGIVFWTVEGSVTEANDAFLALTGYSREDLRSGRMPRWTDMTPPEWGDADRRAIEQVRAKGFAQPFEKEYVRKDGRRVPVLVGPAAFSETREEGVAFVLDLTDRKQAEHKIRRLVEANIIGIGLWTLDGRVTEANDALLALLGYDRDDLLAGRILWTELTPADWQDVTQRALDELKATGRCEPFEQEFFRKDGSRVPVLLGAAMFSETPEEGVAYLLDLTEQKRSEQHLKLMVDELNHRVKNTLATVKSISAQSLRTATSLDGFREAFEQRLQALSKTHNLLNRTFWTDVSLGDLVQQATAPYATGEAGRVIAEGEELRLGPIAAVTVGLALHELATNAARYGAFSTAAGRVRISWRRDEPGRLRLLWEELGGPPVQPPSRRGFGSKLIEKVLAAELRGEVRLEFPPQGVRCDMDMALERVSAH